MPITRQIQESEALDAEGNINPNVDTQYGVRGWPEGKPLYTTVSHHGLVLDLGEHNGYHDSDFFALVWSDELGRPTEVTYGTTRAWTYANNATVDATEGALLKWAAWRAVREAEQAEQGVVLREERARIDAHLPFPGVRVRVVKGRKVPVGTEGVCFHLKAGSWGDRCGFTDNDGDTHWTAADNVERVVSKKDGETWVDFCREEREAWPKKGEIWSISGVPGKSEGPVFWVSDDGQRFGIKLGQAKDDVLWGDTINSLQV